MLKEPPFVPDPVFLFDGDEDYGVATNATGNTLTDDTKSWSTNEWAGGAVIIADGTGAPCIGFIGSNTANTITLTSAWNTNPDRTSRYVLVENYKEVRSIGDSHFPMPSVVRVSMNASEWQSFMADCQDKIDDVKSTLDTALYGGSPPAGSYIKIPAMFYDWDLDNQLENHEVCAWMPNMVNSLVTPSKIIIAKPFGPKDSSGDDYFEEDVKTKITSVTEYFIDDWSNYHYLFGEVHCGTNAKRTPPSTDWW